MEYYQRAENDSYWNNTIAAPIRSLVVTKNWRYLITGDEYGNLCIFDLNFKCINILNIKHSENKAIWSIDFDQYYDFLAVGDETGAITVYNFKELCKVATIHPSGTQRPANDYCKNKLDVCLSLIKENCVIHKLKAGPSGDDIAYGLKFTNNNIIVGVIRES
jgi:WD40 repeat protein